jgi:hypothetical protein
VDEREAKVPRAQVSKKHRLPRKVMWGCQVEHANPGHFFKTRVSGLDDVNPGFRVRVSGLNMNLSISRLVYTSKKQLPSPSTQDNNGPIDSRTGQPQLAN